MGTNTGIGIGIGIPFKNNALGGDRPYLPPELKARLIGVWDNYGKKNTDADRNIIKNKIPNAGGDLEILNAAYKLNSGFGKYSEDFTTWTKSSKITSVDSESFDFVINANWNLLYYKSNIGKDIPSFKVHIKLKGEGKVFYNYITSEGVFTNKVITSEEYVVPISYNTKYTGETPVNCGFSIHITSEECSGTITQIPNFEGAFVTDGVNDMIISQKTLQEMGVTKDFTIVSMIHQITLRGATAAALTNYIRQPVGYEYVRNHVANIGKTGIYGYAVYDVNQSSAGNSHIINTILGDKNDYSIHIIGNLSQGKFSVQGYINGDNNIVELSQVAWYWTFIAKRVLTTDEINQVIAYFNLDKYVKPDIYYDVKKQGLTNDIPDEDWYLKDFSGNGRDMTLYNYARTPESGINEEGGLQSDGVDDYGQFVGDLGLKDYTVVIDRAYPIVSTPQFTATSDATGENANTPFLIEHRSVNANESTYSYLANNAISINKEREICYQSTYQYKDTVINKGSSTSLGTGLTIARYGINNGYSALALYSFMLFHYSMSKFLIERQLKKHKLGTLYPNMVEFRPIIKSNVNYQDIIVRNTSTGENLIVGQYYNLELISIYVKPLYYEEVSTIKVNNINAEFNSYDKNTGYYRFDCIVTKSPQKINLTIEQDENYVQWNPNIKANVSKYSVTANIRKTDGTTLKLVNGQFYSTSITGNLILDIVPPYKDSDEVTNVVIDGKSYTPTKDSSGNYYRLEIPLVFPKEINITIQEYVRYEDIVQPYPVLLRFKDENSNEISWGDKIKLGSSITRIGLFNDCNLLKDIYTVSNAKLNGSPLPNTPHVVERQMVFTCTATWIFDDNEPNCILSPRLLRVPNSSYKILGHIPDISGHGNHGVIYNSAYAEGSGVNEDGSYQFDGVDDFVAIPTLSKGGKQVLMKVNWSTLNGFIYDQRPVSGDKTFGIYTQGDVIAYSQHNNGNTYIDGIINNNIIGSNLSKITHNIVATCDVDNSITPSIGKRSYSNSYFAQMSLYDFMLFDEISTDDKIKELNTHIGITPKVTLPNYYWDNYGKKNTDANRGYINEQVSLQKTGTSVNPLENFNIGYEGMSGYNGYPVVFGANKTWETSNAVDYIYDINSTIVHITNVKHVANGLLYSYVKRDGALANIKEIPAFRVTVKGLEGNSKFVYKYLATENATKESIVYLGNGIYKLPKSFVPTDALLDLTTNSWIGFAITSMIEGELVFDCDITIEILPEYENGLVYDGVSDFTDNKNIPIFTDFTAIIKRVDLDAKNDNSTVMFKGNKIYESSIGNGFILDYCYNNKNYVYSYGKLNQIERDDSKIIYLTPESYNANPIIKGENRDNLGLVLGKYWKGIIYKTILYSKTISLLEINFLKNLMEKDEIIDLTNPIFIKNE
jgi:hypothetical protein|nr:MAG TPA: hypothetical protein [Crassvirales sp.]